MLRKYAFLFCLFWFSSTFPFCITHLGRSSSLKFLLMSVALKNADHCHGLWHHCSLWQYFALPRREIVPLFTNQKAQNFMKTEDSVRIIRTLTRFLPLEVCFFAISSRPLQQQVLIKHEKTTSTFSEHFDSLLSVTRSHSTAGKCILCCVGNVVTQFPKCLQQGWGEWGLCQGAARGAPGLQRSLLPLGSRGFVLQLLLVLSSILCSPCNTHSQNWLLKKTSRAFSNLKSLQDGLSFPKVIILQIS